MLGLEYSDLAAEDLLRIADYESDISIPLARRTLQEFDVAIELLRRLPGIGHPHRDLLQFPDLEVWNVGKYAIVFRADPAMLRIVRIIPASADLRALPI
jgi:plasmid stabilization system protein ParE